MLHNILSMNMNGVAHRRVLKVHVLVTEPKPCTEKFYLQMREKERERNEKKLLAS